MLENQQTFINSGYRIKTMNETNNEMAIIVFVNNESQFIVKNSMLFYIVIMCYTAFSA